MADDLGEEIALGRVREESVEALLENVRDLARAEEARGETFNQRAGWLLGFAGVVLALTAAQIRQLVGPATDLGAIGEPLSIGSLTLSIGFIVGSAVCAILAMFPRNLWHIGIEEIQRYPTLAYVSQERKALQGRAMRGLIRQLAEERVSNGGKAKYIRWGFVSLGIGLSVLAGQVFIFLGRTAGIG